MSRSDVVHLVKRLRSGTDDWTRTACGRFGVGERGSQTGPLTKRLADVTCCGCRGTRQFKEAERVA